MPPHLLKKSSEAFFKLDDFVPSLRQEIERPPLNLDRTIRVAIQAKEPKEQRALVPAPMERRSLALSDGENFCRWQTDSLRALFRGDQQPPHLGDVPVAYNECFALLDLHALEMSNYVATLRRTLGPVNPAIPKRATP